MSLAFSLLFYIKKSKADRNGKTNIYLRITLDGRRTEFSVHRKIRVDWWNSKTQLAMGNSKEAQNINQHLSILRNKTYSIQQNFERENRTYTATNIRDVLLGKDKKYKMVSNTCQNGIKHLLIISGAFSFSFDIEFYVPQLIPHLFVQNDLD